MFSGSTITMMVLLVAAMLVAAPASGIDDPSDRAFRWFPGTAIFAVILAVLHILAPQIRRILKGRESIVGSFGGGMAAAYVFVHLLPELDSGHAVFGRMIFVVSLASFVVYYGISKLLHLLSERKKLEGENFYLGYFAVVQWAVYNWLIVYGTPAEVAESGWRAVAIAVAMGLHLVHADFSLGSEHPRLFDAVARYCLAAAVLVGWLTVVVDQKTNETVNDLFVAILAGTLIYGIFHEEIPEQNESRFWWFLAGAVGFVAFVALYL